MQKIFVLAALIVTIFFFAATTHAEMQTYEGIGEYLVMPGETHDFAKQRAKKIAERDALEQIYIYVLSESSAKNSNLAKDEIIVISAGLMNVLKTKYSVTKAEGSFLIKAVVIAEIDPDEIAEAVEREKKRRNLP